MDLRRRRHAGAALRTPVMMGGRGSRILPQNLIAEAGTGIEDFEDDSAFALSGAGTAVADNTTQYKNGTQSVKVTTPTGTTIGRISRVLASPFYWDTNKHVRLWFYCHDTNMQGLSIQLGQGGDVTNSWSASLYHNHQTRPGWVLAHVPYSAFSPTGSPNIANPINFVRINVTASAGNVSEMSFDELRVNVRTQPAVFLSFDDNATTQYTEAFAYLKPRKIKATCYIRTNSIDVSGMTLAQITEMFNNGWDMANHTDDHTTLTGLSQAAAQAHIAAGKAALDGWGFSATSDHFATPGGAFDGTVRAACAAEGVVTHRSVQFWRYPVLPIDDNYYIGPARGNGMGNSYTVANFKSDIEAAYLAGEVYGLYGHSIATPESSTTISPDNFKEIINYIVSKNMPILTLSQLKALESGSIVIPGQG